MAIAVKLDDLLHERRMTLTELAESEINVEAEQTNEEDDEEEERPKRRAGARR